MNRSQLLYVLVDMQNLKRNERVQPLDRRPRRVPSRGALAAVLFGVPDALIRRVRGAMIEVEGISKSFGETRALVGVERFPT
jgi:hypothetical protein